MASYLRKNRLSPPLMFAFRSAHESESARRAAGPEEGGARRWTGKASRIAVTEYVLRREVARDLEQLMNTIALEAIEDLDEFPSVAKSILNYGLPDIAQRTIDEAEAGDIAREIAGAVARFEPRLAAQTLEVTRDENASAAALRLRFVVRAELICSPINVPVEFVADVEYDSGKIVINRA